MTHRAAHQDAALRVRWDGLDRRAAAPWTLVRTTARTRAGTGTTRATGTATATPTPTQDSTYSTNTNTNTNTTNTRKHPDRGYFRCAASVCRRGDATVAACGCVCCKGSPWAPSSSGPPARAQDAARPAGPKRLMGKLVHWQRFCIVSFGWMLTRSATAPPKEMTCR